MNEALTLILYVNPALRVTVLFILSKTILTLLDDVFIANPNYFEEDP